MSTATNTDNLKARLRNVEAQVADANAECREAIAERNRARDEYAASPNLDTGSPLFAAAQAAMQRVSEAEERLASLRDEHIGVLKLLGRDVAVEAAPTGSLPYPRTPGWNSAAIFTPDTRAQLAALASSTMPTGRVALGQVADRDALAASFMSADVAATSNMRRGEFLGVLPQLRRQLRLLDLIPTGTMDGQSVPFTEEGGSFTTAVETAESTAKPEAAITLTDRDAAAKTIAHWIKVRKQALSDAPALQSTIDGRLRYGVEQRLEAQIITGNGTGENLRGVLNTTGIGTVDFDGGELVADQVLRGIVNVYLAGAQANGVLMHPTDWRAAVVVKAVGDGQYYSGGPFTITPQVMWGVPLIPSEVVPEGTVLVGDFALGAQLFIREGVNVLLSDADQDDFINNRVTLLAEMRAALAVWRPAAFCTVDLTA